MGGTMSDTFPIEPNDRYAVIAASAGQTLLTIPFPFLAEEDIKVVQISSAGVETPLAQPNDYTVTGEGDEDGGTATLIVPALAGQTYRITGNAILKRITSIVQNSRFSARTQDNELDRLVIIAQELNREIARAFRVPYGAPSPTIEIGEDGQLLMFSGGNLIAGPTWSELGGIAGPGVPAGGVQYQVLTKVSAGDFNTEWRTLGMELLDFTGITAKITPVDADVVLGLDSADSLKPKRWTFANIKAWILTWLAAALGPLYPAVTAKASPLTADGVLITDSADSSKSKLLTLGNLRTWLTSFFDTRFSPGYGYLFGLETANNTSDATNDIDISAGVTVDNTTLGLITVAAMTKRLDANWAPGSGNGGRYSGAAIANTTYHLWAVGKADGTGGDIYCDPSPDRATVLAHLNAETGGSAYTNARRISPIVRTGGAIKAFKQYGDRFVWSVPAVDVSITGPGTSAVTATLTLPTGIVIEADVYMSIRADASDGPNAVLLTALTQADTTPAAGAGGICSLTTGTINAASDDYNAAQFSVMTNTSAQVRYRFSKSDAFTIFTIATNGWRDTRGRF